jgi:hypothetical protein
MITIVNLAAEGIKDSTSNRHAKAGAYQSDY